MRKSFVALLLMGAAAILTNVAFAQSDGEPGLKLVNAQLNRLRLSRATRLGTSAAPGVDTTYVGHKPSAFNSVTNPWAVGTGPYQPSVSPDGLWDWDSFGAGENDSLQGWWPIRQVYLATGGLTLPDKSRPWWGIDFGNNINYVLNSQHQNRTTGIIGAWHVDGGNLTPAPGADSLATPTWGPINGTGSAWCGLRAHGDNTYVDAVTGNPFNANVADWNGLNGAGSGTSKNYPGYASQWDQMLYRDVRVADGASITVGFKYNTHMSTGADLVAATRVGWFDKDPTAVTAGNFISSTDAAANAPVDSFMVYVGVPANPTACKHADGLPAGTIYDLKRRWFSEVIDINSPYTEILTVAGDNNGTPSIPLANAVIQPMLNASNAAETGTGGVIRVVFRSHTNSNFSDEGTAYSSGTKGAAIIDDVSITGGAAAISSPFDVATEINNAIEPANSGTPGPAIGQGYALGSWHSTGKPPAIYHHTHPIFGGFVGAGNFYAPLAYNELCGPVDSPNRACNIDGVVISSGDHDHGERAGGSLNTAEEELQDGFVSPTVNMVIAGGSNNVVGVGTNGVGLDNDDVIPTDDYYVEYDLYAGIYNLNFSGNAWFMEAMSYPAKSVNYHNFSWGELRSPPFIIFNPEPQCFTDAEGFLQNGIVLTSNASGVPDSMRIYLGKVQECFRFAVSLGCSPTGGSYFDNVSLAFIDKHGTLASNSSQALGSVSAQIWMFYNDAFPKNETPGLPGTAAFDTTSAITQTGLNNGQATGNANRFDIPGDSTAVTATGGGMRVDMVFRILPGPGNYVTPGVKSSGLRKVPSSAVAAVSGDNSFWGQYLASNDGGSGFGSAGGHAGGVWNVNVWNSARCDSTGTRVFPVQSKNVGLQNTAGTWANNYEETDPKFATLGILHNRCFLIDTSTSALTTSSNITCGTGTYPPAWVTTVPPVHTGWDGTTQTKNFTKILPDGILTPGSHVEYWFRKSTLADPATFTSCPDTAFIFPQNAEGPSTDGHRWQEFSVLPDAWKFSQYGGLGQACMLFVDLNDRRGNERAFIGVADSIGLTRAAKYGAHNGWHASAAYNNGGAHANTMDYSNLAVGGDPTISVWAHGGEAGTAFDMYGVKASESITTGGGGLGGRLATPATGYAAGKDAKIAPTPEMLRTYYRQLLILTGDLTSGILGPFVNRSQDDLTLLEDYMGNTSGSATPRGVWVMGDGFAQSETQTAGAFPAHATLLSTYFAATLRDPSYQVLSGNQNNVADLLPTSVVSPRGDVMGVQNTCLWSNDLLAVNAAVSGATAASFYENFGANGPYISGVYAPSSGTRPWISLLDGWDVEHLHSRFDENSFGRLVYFMDVLANVFAGQCSNWGTPAVDVPNMPTRQVLNYMNLANNPLRSGQALVNFGITKSDRVQIDVYDVSGRHVRNLADRVFAPGQYKLTWDGTNDGGVQVSRGVYFTQVKYVNSRFVDSKKLTVLK